MEERAPRFRREVAGLVQKYYGYDSESGAFCGCYIFDSEESRQAFRQSELARTIPAAYQAQERVEAYEVLFPYMRRDPSWRNKPGTPDEESFTEARRRKFCELRVTEVSEVRYG